MTLDDFKAQVSARFPGAEFTFTSGTDAHRATHERCRIIYWRHPTVIGRWLFGVTGASTNASDTLDGAIDAHQLCLQLITTNAQAMGLL